MSATQLERPIAAPGTRCLLLQLEPTPYILPRALYVYRDPDLHTDLIWTYVNSSQDWGADADIGNLPVLLDSRISKVRQLARVARLMMNILRGQYTVAHLAGWGHWVVRLAILSCKLRGVPFSLESDTSLNRDLSGWREWVKKKTYPVLLNWASVGIPGGTRQANLFRYYGVPEEKIHISHMTVDTRRVRALQTKSRAETRAEEGIAPERVLMLFVGRLVGLKRLDVLLEAFEGIMTEHSTLDLVVIGDGPLRGALEDWARVHPGRLKLLGRQNQECVVAWMRACDFLVLTSDHEQWGLVVNEAMTCGLPVIVSDACGCVDDLVLHGRTGLVFPSGDKVALAAAIRELAGKADTRERMSNQAEKLIEPWIIERQAETIRAALVRMSHAR